MTSVQPLSASNIKRIYPCEDQRSKKWIAVKKVGSFKTLFNRVKVIIGNYNEAIQYLKLSNGTVDNMNKNRVSETTARKILDGYNRLIK